MTNTYFDTASEHIRLAKQYFFSIDSADTALLDMFTDDAQFFFPKIGTVHGKQQIAKAAQAIMKAAPTFYHNQQLMVFTHSRTRLVVEGIESGYLADKTKFPGTALSEGRFCNVFEFNGSLISRLHIYVDPDFAGKYDLLLSKHE